MKFDEIDFPPGTKWHEMVEAWQPHASLDLPRCLDVAVMSAEANALTDWWDHLRTEYTDLVPFMIFVAEQLRGTETLGDAWKAAHQKIDRTLLDTYTHARGVRA